MIRLLLLSVFLWLVVYFVSLRPDQQRLDKLKQRANNLQTEIDKIDNKLLYLQAEREDLMNNDRFYIRKLSREKLRLATPLKEPSSVEKR